MSLSPDQLILIALALIAAGAAQGASGFGFGLVAVGVLGGILPLKQASVMLVLASLSLNLYILFRLRRHFIFERMTWMLAGCIVGVPLGVWLLVRTDETLLRRILGIVLLLTVAQRFLPLVKGKRWHPVWVGAPCGLFSGGLSGAFATGGPPVVAYVQSQCFDRFRYVASVQVALALSAVVRVGCLGTARLLTWQLLAFSALGAVCAVAGSWLGLHILKRLPERALRVVIAAMLLALAGR